MSHLEIELRRHQAADVATERGPVAPTQHHPGRLLVPVAEPAAYPDMHLEQRTRRPFDEVAEMAALELAAVVRATTAAGAASALGHDPAREPATRTRKSRAIDRPRASGSAVCASHGNNA